MLKKIILATIIVILIVLIGYFILPTVIPNKIQIEVGSDIEEINRISLLKNIIILNAQETDKIDTTTMGKYKVKYSYKYLFMARSINITIEVKDTTPPEFKNFKENVKIYQNEQFIEEYTVIDNYDKKEDITVELNGSLDTTTFGDYYLTYTATDTSGNKTEIKRKITVIRELPIDINDVNYSLEKYFSETILDQTPEISTENMNKIYFIGDSVYRNIERFNIYDSSKVWAEPCLNPNNIYQKKIKINNKKEYTIPELIEINKPEYIVVHIGGCQISKGEGVLDEFIEEYTLFLNDIKNKSPNTKVIIQTFNPVIERTVTPYINNVSRNKYNYYVTEMCEKLGIKVLDITSIFKDELGNYKKELYLEDMNHPNKEGLELIIEYIKTHSYQ